MTLGQPIGIREKNKLTASCTCDHHRNRLLLLRPSFVDLQAVQILLGLFLFVFVAGKSTYGVPDLKLDDFAIDQKAIAAEFDSDSDLMLLLELVVHDALHQTGLAHGRVSNDDELVKVVLRRQRLIRQHLERDLLDLLNLALLHLPSFLLLLAFA